MKPSKLKLHLATMHFELVSQPVEYFERYEELNLKQKVKITPLTSVNEIARRASYLVALRVARSKKPHKIVEALILPARVVMCEVVLESEYSQKRKAIQLSDSTVSRRVAYMSEDLCCQLIARLQHATFIFQLNEFCRSYR
ncbi:hypothetical protein RF11_10816 [Thelohanellus kitauei]|uniref:SCAN domain-containing protein 3 n=1 Tax=Thelohanellus kitauei TaxID=669202 RepID=A0A0C2JGQ0_THEKT|nr:hypothetical protein RF11_10816 [Thelohanellus kitauei]